MSLLVFQHHKNDPPAALGSILQNYSQRLRVVDLGAGDPIPPDLDDVDGIISLGGPQNVDETDQHAWLQPELDYLKQAHAAGVPIVGICLGAQLLAVALGGEVAAMPQTEVGWHNVKLAFPGTTDPLHAGIPWDTMQLHLHGYEVTKLPPGGVPLSGSKQCRTQAFKVGMTSYGFQYHFEWEEAQLPMVAKTKMWDRAATSNADFDIESQRYFNNYRRLGNRLCHQIALLLFPVNKRK